jgi:hypothetical protein
MYIDNLDCSVLSSSSGHLEKLALVWPLALSTPVAAVGLAGRPERNTEFFGVPISRLPQKTL